MTIKQSDLRYPRVEVKTVQTSTTGNKSIIYLTRRHVKTAANQSNITEKEAA